MRLDLQARKYAAALFAVAEQTDKRKEILESLSLINRLLKENAQFRAFIHSKRLDNGQKANILSRIIGEGCHTAVLKFIEIVKEENLVSLLQDMKKAYRALYMEAMNLVNVTAHVATSLEKDDELAIKNALDDALKKTADLSVHVDPNLMGGIKLRIGNTFLDASIQNQLETLKQELLGA